MNSLVKILASAVMIMVLLGCVFSAYAKTLIFSNLTWVIRNDEGGPGPNHWSDKNAWVDKDGRLHLKITDQDGTWYCPEVYTTESLGFGQYWFYTIGRIDKLDPNVVLGLFNYPAPGVVPEGTNEIDIEFSKWGSKEKVDHNSSYTVWPSVLAPNKISLFFTMTLSGDFSTHGFTWQKKHIFYQSGYGHYKNYVSPILSWLFAPPDFNDRIPQQPLPVHINLWLLGGTAPKNGKEVEVIIEKFCFKSRNGKGNNCNGSSMA